MSLELQIKQYYLDNFSELPEAKRFHYATRLAAWLGEPTAYEELKHLRTYILPERYKDNLSGLMSEVLATEQTGRRNAHDLRQPYFLKYPDLYGLHLALFRIRHLKYVYGIDSTDALLAVFSRQKLDTILNQLVKDDRALRVLSTFAVNTIYLHDLLFGNSLANPRQLLMLADGYDRSNKIGLQLLIYLFTHCIIGESNFYTQDVSEKNLPTYRNMLDQLDQIISDEFENINLDNKLEFLVCARICNYKTSLDEKIFSECEKSISPSGTFLIDMHNHNIQLERQTFVASEHRNVLFIMAKTPYVPHSTLI